MLNQSTYTPKGANCHRAGSISEAFDKAFLNDYAAEQGVNITVDTPPGSASILADCCQGLRRERRTQWMLAARRARWRGRPVRKSAIKGNK